MGGQKNGQASGIPGWTEKGWTRVGSNRKQDKEEKLERWKERRRAGQK